MKWKAQKNNRLIRESSITRFVKFMEQKINFNVQLANYHWMVKVQNVPMSYKYLDG